MFWIVFSKILEKFYPEVGFEAASRKHIDRASIARSGTLRPHREV